ncbi:VOC family protein [Nonomuraea sp. NPDC049695]|uniref:VOC family protein n=1 Tax=Nonomuraea sp. NPDC049695 TaxID=3154734 RepID=UPI0034357BCC
MDVLYPRLLVRDFPACAAFYQAVLRELLGVEPARFLPGYASWDIEGQTGLSLFGRGMIAEAVGTADLPRAAQNPVQDSAMLVMKVDDVDKAADCLTRHGATVAAPPQDRPDWGPTLRTAHLRDPEGNLIEVQSY